MFEAVNTRLPFVKQDDKEEYLKDFKKLVKKSSLVKSVIDETSHQKFYELSTNIMTGVISKPE